MARSLYSIAHFKNKYEQTVSNMSLLNKRIKLSIFLGILVIFSVSISVSASSKSRRAILKEKWEKDPSVKIGYWGDKWKKTPLAERIKEAPTEVIEKLHFYNKFDGFDERPSTAKPPPELSKALKSVESSMPDKLKAILNEGFIGIFSVKELGGTGYVCAVYNKEGNEKYGLIVLDVDVLMKKKANEWATWKENSGFRPKPDGKVKLKAVIEEEENNTVVNAFRYIILHEMGHVLGMVTKSHPWWTDWFVKKKVKMDFPFQWFSWAIMGKNKVRSLFDDKFPERKYIKYYAFENAKLTSEQIPAIYNKLIKYTNFPSLYAAQNMYEDFAESFATYFHVVMDKRPWQIIIEQDGQPEIVIQSCWEEERCKRKKEYMKRWFENPLAVDTH